MIRLNYKESLSYRWFVQWPFVHCMLSVASCSFLDDYTVLMIHLLILSDALIRRTHYISYVIFCSIWVKMNIASMERKSTYYSSYDTYWPCIYSCGNEYYMTQINKLSICPQVQIIFSFMTSYLNWKWYVVTTFLRALHNELMHYRGLFS